MKKPYPFSDHYDGKHFHNPDRRTGPDRSFWAMLKFTKDFALSLRWPGRVPGNVRPQLANGLSMQQTHITYINHACHLIQLKGLNILTDPIFSKRASPIPFMGPKRVRAPGMRLQQLPHIHVVVISHNHYDHMDLPSLKKIDKLFHPLFIVPLGNKKYLKALKNVIELDWWQKYTLNELQSITMVPAQHWSMRKPGDAYKALWSGYWIESGPLKIYFTGDSGYGPHFKTIAEKLGAPTISILPIGAYEPRWFMMNQHMNPEDAVCASEDLNSELNIATHYLTFKLSSEGMGTPAQDLKRSLHRHGIKEERFLVPVNGETIIYECKNSF